MFEWLENLPEWAQRFLAGFLAGLAAVAVIAIGIAPLVLSIVCNAWGFCWAYVVVVPVLIGVFFACDLF